MLLAFFFTSFSLFAQSNSIVNMPSGNGPILSGLKIDDVKLINDRGNLANLGIGSMTSGKEVVVTEQVRVDCYYSGTITQYVYNGKTYDTEYVGDKCRASCFQCKGRYVKMTAVVDVAGKGCLAM